MLRDAWLGGSAGHFSAMAEACIWALREAWREFKESEDVMTKFIAGRVKVVGGGGPWPSATTEFFKKVDADPERYPGKKVGSKPGPMSVITVQSQLTLARSEMAMKERGEEPTYAALVPANPKALLISTDRQACREEARVLHHAVALLRRSREFR